MQFTHTIIYVQDVEATVLFYKKVFDIDQFFMHESKQYAELNTGGTKLAFAAEIIAENNELNCLKNRPDAPAAGVELALMTEDVDGAYQKAIDAGAEAVKEPTEMPWEQKIAYVRDLNGILIELCGAMAH